MKQKTPVYRNLRSIPVYFEDTSLNSDELFRITEFPLRLTAGKNIFKLQGNPSNLNNGSYLNIEILDYNGDPIYNEVTSVITEDDSRIVSVYIYGDTPPGDALVTLVTVANSLYGQPIPSEWKDKPNVRWSRIVPVNPTQENISEIIFNELPTVTLKEQVGVQLNRTYVTTQYPTYSTGKVQYISKNSQPVLIISGGSFNSEMVGGTVTIASPANPFPTPYYSVGTIPYSSTIKKVLSTSSILLDTEYKVASSESIIPHTYNMFGLSTYSISYEATPTYVPTQNSESYALIEIDNLEPVSGDVSRIKVFMNNMGTVGTWELINDIELEETNIFVTNTASVEPYKSIGDITSQSVINTYYTAASYLGKSTQTAPTLIYDNTDISNAIKISSPADLSGRNRVHVLRTNSSVAGKFVKGASYKITFDAVGTKTLATGDTAPNLLIYVSGSAFKYDYGDYYNQELPIRLGKKVGDLYTYNDSQRFDDQTFYFDADETGDGVLIFVIKGGEWKISDIRTTTDNDKGFTPAYTRLRSLVPTPHKSNVQFSFKIEYYNSDGAKSKQVNYLDNISWNGGNRYIDGEYSMMTGSLYVADSLENGIAISGYKDTGYIRSLGYDGFNAGYPGFLLWSGSAMKSTNNNYNGVGLELYADRDNYFRYRTVPSELVVKTKSFYFGSSSQYISGSNGKLAISSSNFYLDSNGNVTLSGTVNITDGSGFATPADLTAVSSSLSSSIANNSASAATSIGSVSSSLTTVSSSLTTVSSSLSDATARIVTDANAKITKTNDTPSTGKGLYLSQNYLGYYNASAWNAYISSSGDFLFKKDDNNLISFGGSPSSFILKVSDTVFMSGSNISLLTPNFFFGGSNQYISGSNGKLAISSSNFYLDSNGNVTLSGTVNITSGTGFATPTSVSASINTATGSLSASLNTTINANSSSAATSIGSVSSSLNTVSSSFNTSLSDATARIVTDANAKITKTNDTPGGSGLFLSQNYLGYYNSSNWNAYISSSGDFLFKKDDNNLISFGNNAFILKVSDTATISGSNINLITPNFFFGNGTQFISGSGGNLQIKSNNFNVNINGQVTASRFVAISGSGVNRKVMLDTDSLYSDAYNIGRVLYQSDIEKFLEIQNLTPTLNPPANPMYDPGVVISFPAFILPGETSLQISYTYEYRRTNAINTSLVLGSFIYDTYSGSFEYPSTSYYNLFQNSELIGQCQNLYLTQNTYYSGTVNKIQPTLSGDTSISSRQGRYVNICLCFYRNANLNTPFGSILIKNIVVRSSRRLGSITEPVPDFNNPWS